MTRTKLIDRKLPIYTKGEEIFNMTSHICGAVLGIVALVLCIIFSSVHHNVYGIISRNNIWSNNDTFIYNVKYISWT